ncbi:hypothetical protein [Aliiroseovarius lamellibrachiae]|uniref:hypothetical protein n=1 Tax=Aliiroseovarius lamellibrachiae TaxID=1924933 RepID=UPI001BE09209|nr:hypothetical protein [Aliiroseovarius lamellibrachiae]MBT2130138.1 hypothetical protein [Aliiroseovarius lamellibrachiae]
MNRVWVLFLIGAVSLAGWQGYRLGYRASEAAKNAEHLAQIEAGKMLEAARLKAAAERDDLHRKLEEKAYADPVVVERCLGPDRVQRLNALR